MMSQLLKRALVLPPFWRRVQSSGTSQPCTLAYLFDYAAFAKAFPQHREAAHRARLPRPARFHIVLGDGSASDDPDAVTFRAGSSKGAKEV